jgi:hypothetical protein
MAYDIAREIYKLSKIQERIEEHEKSFLITLNSKSKSMNLCVYKDNNSNSVKVSFIGCMRCNFRGIIPDLLIYEERLENYDLTRIASKVILKGFFFGTNSNSNFCCERERSDDSISMMNNNIELESSYIDINILDKNHKLMYMRRIDTTSITYNCVRIENEKFFLIAKEFADIFHLCVKSLHETTKKN